MAVAYVYFNGIGLSGPRDLFQRSRTGGDSLPPPPLGLLPAGATLAGRELHPLKIIAFHGARQVLLDQDSGPFYLWRQKAGVNFTNPRTLTWDSESGAYELAP